MQQYPEEWKTAQIRDIAYVKGGKRLPKGEKLSDEPTPFPYIRVTDLKNFSVRMSDIKYLEPKTQESIRRYNISVKDIYISIAGTIGLTGIIPHVLEGANLTENAAKIVLKSNNVDAAFVMFYLASSVAQHEIKSQTVKNAQPKLALSRIESIEIPLPPLFEQCTISHILSLIQTAIEQQEMLISLTRELKSAIMHRLFSEGLRGEPQKETEIGLIPESWIPSTLEDITFLRKESVNPLKHLEGIYIGLEHIEPSKFWYSSYGKPSDVRSTKNTFYQGDVLYGKLRPYLDKAVIATNNGICSTDILVMTPKPSYSKEFLICILHMTQLLSFAKKTTSGVNHPRTSWNSLKEFMFGLPQNEEREEIAQIIMALEYKILYSEKKKTILEELFRTLLRQLMTGQIRVNEIDFMNIAQELTLK